MRGHRVAPRPAVRERSSRRSVPVVLDLRRAACAGHPQPWLWDDTIDGETPDQHQQRRTAAAKVCRDCPELRRCPTAAHPPQTVDDSGEWWPTRRACEHLGIPVTSWSTKRLRARGIRCRPGPVPGGPLLWDAEQVRSAPPHQPRRPRTPTPGPPRRRGRPPASTSYDEAVVSRLVDGEPLPGKNAAVRGAKIEAIRRLTDRGLPLRRIARRVGYSERHVQHLRAQLGIRAA